MALDTTDIAFNPESPVFSFAMRTACLHYPMGRH